MTTIATDGRTIAADSQTTCGHTITSKSHQKLFRFKDGRAAGASGVTAEVEGFIKWLITDDQTTEAPSFEGEVIIIDGSNLITVYESSDKPLRVPAPYVGGSGGRIALGAMLAGADPKTAVKLACERDVYSGGTVRSITVKG